jgi:hypothetical protein
MNRQPTMSPRFNTSRAPDERRGHMPHAMRSHHHGPIQPMEQPGFFARLFGRA